MGRLYQTRTAPVSRSRHVLEHTTRIDSPSPCGVAFLRADNTGINSNAVTERNTVDALFALFRFPVFSPAPPYSNVDRISNLASHQTAITIPSLEPFNGRREVFSGDERQGAALPL